MRVACVLVTHLGARVEMRRHPRLKDRPAVIIDRSLGKPLVADRFPAASGARAGMTMEEPCPVMPAVWSWRRTSWTAKSIEYWVRCSAGKETCGERAGHCGERRGTDRW